MCTLDALGDETAPDGTGEGDQGGGQRFARRAGFEVGDHRDVELYDVGAEPDQVPQAGMASPRVVDGQAQAGAAQRLDGDAKGFVVGNGLPFGDLQHDPLEWCVGEQIGEARVMDEPGGEVHRHPALRW